MRVEDFRPTEWHEIVGQPVDEIAAMIDGYDTPNFLFYGPAGTGKTSTAYLIARDLTGSADEVMEFNASDDRGIDMVRDRIIPKVDQRTLTGKPRVVLLDEMESMTTEAQQALRQPMEQSKSVFVLTCNDPSNVIGALKSRCHNRGYEFGHIPSPAIRERLEQIIDQHDLDVSGQRLDAIVSFANGDMRSAISKLIEAAKRDDPEPVEHGSQGSLEANANDYLKTVNATDQD